MSRYKKRRLYQILVEAGLVKSKKEALNIVRSERITVDGKVVTSLHYQVNPKKKIVAIDNKPIKLKDERRYFILNKPAGIETTKENILQFLKSLVDKKELFAFYPVGRLDKETSGLLIVTNDGRFGNKVLNPEEEISKTYHAKVKGFINDVELKTLKEGVVIELEDKTKYVTLPAKIDVLERTPNYSWIAITITEGKKRQIRKMCDAIKRPVLELKRISIGKLELKSLKEGTLVELRKNDILRVFE